MLTAFWHLDIGNVATWVGVIIVFLGWVRRSGKFEESISSLTKANEALAAKVESMDNHGTNWSQRGLERETELTKSNTRRLDILDGSMSKQGPEIARIGEAVDWIKHSIQKNGH